MSSRLLSDKLRTLGGRLGQSLDGLGREFWGIGFLTLIQGFAWFLVAPMFALFARSLGANDMLVGLYTVFPPLLSVLVTIPCGVLVSSVGPRRVFECSFVVGLLAGAAYALSPVHWLLWVPQALFGLSSALFWPSQASFMTEVIPGQNREKMLGFMMSLTVMGAVLGPASAGLVAERACYRAVFVLYMAAEGLSLVACRLLPPPRRRVGRGLIRDAVAGSVGSGLAMLSNPNLVLTTVVTISTYVLWTLLETFFPLYLQDRGYSIATIGGMVTLRIAAMTAARLGLGAILGVVRTVPLMFLSLGVTAVFAAFTPFVKATSMLLGFTAIMGAASGILPVLTTMHIAMVTSPGQRPVALAVDSTACSLGRMAASSVLGVVARASGSDVSLLVGGVAIAAAAAGAALWWNYRSGEGTGVERWPPGV